MFVVQLAAPGSELQLFLDNSIRLYITIHGNGGFKEFLNGGPKPALLSPLFINLDCPQSSPSLWSSRLHGVIPVT